MHTIDLEKQIKKVIPRFVGDQRKIVERIIDDADWRFIIKTLYNVYRDGVPPQDKATTFTLLAIAARTGATPGASYNYSDHKGCLGSFVVSQALLTSFRGADEQYLYRRILESLGLALASDAEGWAAELETAQLALFVLLEKDKEKNAAVQTKAKSRTGKDNSGRSRQDVD